LQQLKRKFKQEIVVLREIRRYQKDANLLILKLCFERVVREIVRNQTSMNEDYKIQALTLLTLQKITEAFLYEFLASKCITHLHYS